jgi:hypothetical protein
LKLDNGLFVMVVCVVCMLVVEVLAIIIALETL